MDARSPWRNRKPRLGGAFFDRIPYAQFASQGSQAFRYTRLVPLFLHFNAWLRRGFRLSRRELIRALAGLSAWAPLSALVAAPADEPTQLGSIRALGPFLDTLLPEDGSPSATALGVDQDIIQIMQRNENIARVVVLGCGWLDQQAAILNATEFALLDPALQESVVTSAEHSAHRSLPRSFFSGMQDLAFRQFYAKPESWPDLGYAGPPQPQGFMDFAEAPAKLPVSRASENEQ